MRVFILLVILFTLKNSECFFSFFPKPCASTPLIADFNLQRYLGKWYEIERLTPIYEYGLDCVTAEYGDLGNGLVSVKNSGVNLALNIPVSIDGTATVVDAAKPNQLEVQFFQSTNLNLFKGNYNVWLTDYDNYAIVYSCSSSWFVKSETVWILSRQKTLSASTLNDAKQYIQSKGVKTNSLYKVKQTCPN